MNDKKLDRYELVKVIREWKHSWMNQRQNSEADYQNYFNRAVGIDANMMHSLAGRIMKLIEEENERTKTY